MNGCFTLIPVSTPFFSAFSIVAVSVLIELNSSAKIFTFALFFPNSFARGWFGDIAQNDIPKMVSGLVVNTSNLSIIEQFTSENRINAPTDLPIQLRCIVLTLLGQLGNESRLSKRSLE